MEAKLSSILRKYIKVRVKFMFFPVFLVLMDCSLSIAVGPKLLMQLKGVQKWKIIQIFFSMCRGINEQIKSWYLLEKLDGKCI